MSERGNCRQCGTEIPFDAPAGDVCPACLLKAGMAGAGSTVSGLGSTGRFTPPTPDALAPRFPQLEILELIGQGGMGAVYKARQIKLDRLVALKVLGVDPGRDEVFAERFTREARALARVSHPHIVGIHDFGEADGLFYFVMEYVDGASLRQVLASGTLAPHEALALVPQVCDALEYAHEAGIVHRDIKPENILIDRKGRVKIADFGLAKIVQPDRLDLSLTVPGQVMGTPAYMAPEQIEKPTAVDHRADIYSLGVVFYEMLTGELPLGRFGPPSSRVRVDVRLDDVVLRTLEKEPERRYQHASDVKVDVESIGASLPRAAKPPTVTPGDASNAGQGDPPKTVDIRRPTGVAWVAAWAFLFAAGLLGSFFTAATMMLWPNFVLGLPHVVSFPAPLRWLLHLPYFQLLAPLLIWALTGWAIFIGVGLLRLRHWARRQAIVLSVIGMLFYFPVGLIASVAVLVYLLRSEVARVFELGEGPATLSVEEARRLERTLGRT